MSRAEPVETQWAREAEKDGAYKRESDQKKRVSLVINRGMIRKPLRTPEPCKVSKRMVPGWEKMSVGRGMFLDRIVGRCEGGMTRR